MSLELKPIIRNFMRQVMSDDRGAPVDPVKIHQLDDMLQRDYKEIELSNLEELLHQIPNLWPKIKFALEKILREARDMPLENRKRILNDPYETIVYMGPQNIKHIFYDVNWELHLNAYNNAMVSARIFHIQSALAHRILPLILNPDWLNKSYRSASEKKPLKFEPSYAKKDIDILEASYACLFSNIGYVLSSVVFKNEFRAYIDALRHKSREYIDSSFSQMESAGYENIFLPIFFRNSLERRYLNYFVDTITRTYLNETGLLHLSNWVSHHLNEHIDSQEKTGKKLSEKHAWSKGALIIAALLVSKLEIDPAAHPLLDLWQHAIASFPKGGKKERDKRINILSRTLLRCFPGFNGDHQELFNKLETICRNNAELTESTDYIEDLKSKIEKSAPTLKTAEDSLIENAMDFPAPLRLTAARVNELFNETSQGVRAKSAVGSGTELVSLIRDFARFLYLFLAGAAAVTEHCRADESGEESMKYRNMEEFYRNAARLTEKNVIRMCDVRMHDTITGDYKSASELLPGVLKHLYFFIMNSSWTADHFRNFKKVVQAAHSLFSRGEAKPYRIYLPFAERSHFSRGRVINSFTRPDQTEPDILEFVSSADNDSFGPASELYEKHRYPRFFQNLDFDELKTEDGKIERRPVFPARPDWHPLEPFIVIDSILLGSRAEYAMKLLTQATYNEKTRQYLLQYQKFNLLEFCLEGADPAVLSPPGSAAVK